MGRMAVLLFQAACLAVALGAAALAGCARGPGTGQAQAIRPSGLKAEFPPGLSCPGVASAYGSSTRYDGSPRPSWAPGGGRHGGIDISLAEGTPLLALAPGTVLDTGEGGMMEGVYLWLAHAPGDTGLPYWIHSKYQHLSALPSLLPGERVGLGQVVGLSGRSGTVGGHYGPQGYPHLHLTIRRGDAAGDPGDPGAGALVDPLSVYRDADPAGPGAARIPCMTSGGELQPPGARLAWPVACSPN